MNTVTTIRVLLVALAIFSIGGAVVHGVTTSSNVPTYAMVAAIVSTAAALFVILRTPKVDDAVRAARAEYLGLFNGAQDAVLLFDPRTEIILDANPSACRMYGFVSSADLIGRSLLEFTTDHERGRDRVDQTLRTRTTVHFETLQRRLNGETMLVEVSASLVEHDGRPAILSINRDVTDRVRALERLRESESRLKEAQRIAKLGSWIFDPARNAATWSDEHYRLLGRTPDGKPVTSDEFLTYCDEESRVRMRQINRQFETIDSQEWELTLVLRDGQQKRVRCVGHAERNDDGSLRRIAGVVQDVTDRYLVEERLRESEERFRFIAQATSDVLWDWHLASDWIWWSDGYTRVFGRVRDERGGTSFADWVDGIHPDDADRAGQSLYDSIESGRSEWQMEYRFRRADGSYALVVDRAFVLRDDNGSPVRLIGAMIDKTDRVRLQEEVARSERVASLGRIATSVAHEVNNVLMGIQANLELVKRRAPDDTKAALGHVFEAIRRGKKITDEVLELTRPVQLASRTVSVVELLADWSRDVRPILAPSISLHIDLDGPQLFVSVDPKKLRQVLTTLAQHAKDSMPEGGSLTVAVRALADVTDVAPYGYVQFALTDTGPGMAPEQLEHLFEPLFTTAHRSGLALATSHQIITACRGTLWATSDPGRGTTFHLALPAEMVPESLAKPGSAQIGIRNVLIVEDDVPVAHGLQLLLESEGVAAEIAALGSRALASLERRRPDAVILDVHLPDCDGTDLYHQIEKRWPGLPVLFSSGHVSADRLEAAMERGSTTLLYKPYTSEALREALSRIAPVQ